MQNRMEVQERELVREMETSSDEKHSSSYRTFFLDVAEGSLSRLFFEGRREHMVDSGTSLLLVGRTWLTAG